MDIAKTFTGLRAILARDPTEDDWDMVLMRLARVDEAPEADRQRFDGEYGHYIRAALERWPADVRAIRWDESRPRALELARTVSVGLTQASATLEARQGVVALLDDPRYASIDGLEVRGLRDRPLEFLDALIAGRPELRRLDLVLRPSLPHEYHRRRADLSVKQVPEVLARVAQAWGGHLEHFGLRYEQTLLAEDTKALDTMWEAFTEHIGSFTRLRSLSLGQMRMSALGSPSWAATVLAHPQVRQVEELCLRCVYKDVEVEHMSAGGAWPNLRRLKMLGATDEDARTLIAAPELSGVDTWAFYDWAPDYRPRGWGGPRTRMWTEWAYAQREKRAKPDGP